jgi:hypothetical protein
MRRILLILAASGAWTNTHAQESSGWWIAGIGNDSCASYVLALNVDQPAAAMVAQGKTYFTMANAYSQWLGGFVSAVNSSRKSGPEQIKVDMNGIALWVKNYCETHPSERLVYGAGAFINAHSARRK